MYMYHLHRIHTKPYVPFPFFPIHQVAMVASAFMKDSSASAYREVFRTLKEQVPGLSVASYMGDFDKAMRKAVRLEFPSIRIHGCHFHYGQALVKNAGSLGLARDIRAPGEVLKKFLAFAALPLLPAANIEEVFTLCAAEAIAVDQRVSIPSHEIESERLLW